jgi:hypothetical protein
MVAGSEGRPAVKAVHLERPFYPRGGGWRSASLTEAPVHGGSIGRRGTRAAAIQKILLRD